MKAIRKYSSSLFIILALILVSCKENSSPVESIAEYQEYTAILNQAGTNAPVATICKNTLGGTPIWFRSQSGVYYAYGANLFPANKTLVFVQSDGSKHYGAYQLDTPNPNSQVALNARNYLTEALEDGVFNITINIKVYR